MRLGMYVIIFLIFLYLITLDNYLSLYVILFLYILG